MCMLCGETRKQGIKEALALADDLQQMAIHQHALARGEADPHGESGEQGAILARSIVRKLVGEYL